MYQEPEIEEVDLDETPDDKQITHDIDEALAKVRPERYDSKEKDWMESVVDLAEEALGKLPRDEVIRDAARRKVYRREAESTKRTNRILRDINDTGQLPLGWGEGDAWLELLFDLLHLPLSIARKRVRLGVASASDLQQWVQESKREEDKRNKAENTARDGAELLAGWLLEQGADRVEDLKIPKAHVAKVVQLNAAVDAALTEAA